MNMRVGSEEIRAYVAAQSQIVRQHLPEEERRLVLRMPLDSVNISPESRALRNARLRVKMDDHGTYEKVTSDTSDPKMKIVENGMREVRKTLGRIKELTALMEDEELTDDDRYATQMRLVELEGELEKRLYKTFYDYNKLLGDQPGKQRVSSGRVVANEWRAALAGDRFDDDPDVWNAMYDSGRDLMSYKKQAAMADRVTALRKEAIARVHMRETDPEAFAEYTEKSRETYRAEFARKHEERGPEATDILETKQIAASEAMKGTTFPTNKNIDFVPDGTACADIDPRNTDRDQLSGDVSHAVDMYEYDMEKYAEDKLAEQEAEDYRMLNAVRISVMDARLAKETDDYVETLTDRLTEQFERFTATLELVESEYLNDGSEASEFERKRLIAEIVGNVMHFLDRTLLKNVTDDSVREEKQAYAVKVEKTPLSPMTGVRDIFAAASATPFGARM